MTAIQNITFIKNVTFTNNEVFSFSQYINTEVLNIYLEDFVTEFNSKYPDFSISGCSNVKAPVKIYNNEDKLKTIYMGSISQNFKTVNLVGNIQYGITDDSMSTRCYYGYSSREQSDSLISTFKKQHYSFSIGGGNYRHYYCFVDNNNMLSGGHMEEKETEEYDSGKENTVYIDTFDKSVLSLFGFDVYIKVMNCSKSLNILINMAETNVTIEKVLVGESSSNIFVLGTDSLFIKEVEFSNDNDNSYLMMNSNNQQNPMKIKHNGFVKITDKYPIIVHEFEPQNIERMTTVL